MYLVYTWGAGGGHSLIAICCRENIEKSKLKFILQSDGNKMNIGGKQFIVLIVHWILLIVTR